MAEAFCNFGVIDAEAAEEADVVRAKAVAGDVGEAEDFARAAEGMRQCQGAEGVLGIAAREVPGAVGVAAAAPGVEGFEARAEGAVAGGGVEGDVGFDPFFGALDVEGFFVAVTRGGGGTEFGGVVAEAEDLGGATAGERLEEELPAEGF